MWFSFYPFTPQQDKALERHPLDRVTQFLQMETPMPKNWNCLVQRDEQQMLCWTKERKQHSKVRLQWHIAHHCGPLHLAPRGETLPSPAKGTWVVTVRLLFYQPNHYFRFSSFSECYVLWPLFFAPPVQNKHEMNMVGRLHLCMANTLQPEKGNTL